MARSGFGTLRRGQVVGARYRIEDLIGRGGMGQVMCATDLHDHRRVALKVPHADRARSRKDVRRLRREARMIAQLTSPFAARLFDTGTFIDDGVEIPYLVLEYVDGVDLATWLRARGPLTATMAATMAWQVCDAIGEAHARGILHRDIKPANLMLSASESGRLVTKVLDFGIARECDAHDPRLTRTADLVGSPTYMAPEQMRPSADVDARADVWALGVVLFEALTGRPPFESASLPELCLKIMLDEPPPLPDSCPAELAACVRRCLANDPRERYASARELADSLRDLASPSLTISPTDLELAALDAAAHEMGGDPVSEVATGFRPLVARTRSSRPLLRVGVPAAVLVLALGLTISPGAPDSDAGAGRGEVRAAPRIETPIATETRAAPRIEAPIAAEVRTVRPPVVERMETTAPFAPHRTAASTPARASRHRGARPLVKREARGSAGPTDVSSPPSGPSTTTAASRARDPLASPF